MKEPAGGSARSAWRRAMCGRKSGQHEYDMGFDASKEFHVWALEWSEGRLDWHLDGKLIRSYTGETPKENWNATGKFDGGKKSFFLLKVQ